MIIRELDDGMVFYRVIVPRWAHAPTSGAGAAKVGGRLNRRGLEALYLSTTVETATIEYSQAAKLLEPGTITSFIVGRVSVVDFSAGYVAGEWDPAWADYACNWRKLSMLEHVEPPSWLLGDLAIDAGAVGILFPSILHAGGINLVLFNSSALSPDLLRVHDPNRELPRDASSWTQRG